MKRERLTSTILTVMVIGLLLFSGPTNAVVVTIDGDSSKEASTTTSLAVASLNATLDIQSAELINLQNYTIRISNSSMDNFLNCSLYLNGSEINDCPYINNSQIITQSNYTSGNLTAEGYTTSGSNETYDSGVGFGYGDYAGATDEVVITFDWEFQKQGKPAGTYYVNLDAVTDDSTKTFTSETSKELTIGSTTINETITSSSSSEEFSMTLGSGTVDVPANVGYISASNITSDVSNYIKGIVGVTENIIISASIGEGIGGVTAENLSTSPNDHVLNIYFNITGTVDTATNYSDVYIAFPKSMIDAISSTAKNYMKVYVKHSDGTDNHYDLDYHENMDTDSEYIFSARVTHFSIFGAYYEEPTAVPANVKSTNIEDVSAIISWTTTDNVTGYINYGTDSSDLSTSRYDIRDNGGEGTADILDYTHY
ncbi:hypothetical protein GF336_03905, partial [Candidatus Woesearchaeota archaeon]|nr:hypothetical protein [Candidatus Woesearchaeota archaeon]